MTPRVSTTISLTRDELVHLYSGGVLNLRIKGKEAEASVENSRAILENAKSEADATRLRIATMKDEMEAKAKGQKALNEAENVFSKEIISLKADIARLEALPKIVEQTPEQKEEYRMLKLNLKNFLIYEIQTLSHSATNSILQKMLARK